MGVTESGNLIQVREWKNEMPLGLRITDRQSTEAPGDHQFLVLDLSWAGHF